MTKDRISSTAEGKQKGGDDDDDDVYFIRWRTRFLGEMETVKVQHQPETEGNL